VDALWLEHGGGPHGPVATKAVGVNSVPVIPKGVLVGSKYEVAVAVHPLGRPRGVNAVINDRLPMGAVSPVSVTKRNASAPEGLVTLPKAFEIAPLSSSGRRTVGFPLPVALTENAVPEGVAPAKLTPVAELPVALGGGTADVSEIPISIVPAPAVPTHEPTLAAINQAHNLAAFIGKPPIAVPFPDYPQCGTASIAKFWTLHSQIQKQSNSVLLVTP
jgi:hypothetical protein